MIDLTCRRAGTVNIERGLPAAGFVNDEQLCRAKAKAATEAERNETQKWNCTPPQVALVDRFCEGKIAGDRCTVELTYLGSTERNEGVCKKVVETERFYYQGHRQATRDVIRCEPEQPVTHEYKSVGWLQKLLQ